METNSKLTIKKTQIDHTPSLVLDNDNLDQQPWKEDLSATNLILKSVDTENYMIDPDVVFRMPQFSARKFKSLPYSKVENKLIVLTSTSKTSAFTAVSPYFKEMNIKCIPVTEERLKNIMEHVYRYELVFEEDEGSNEIIFSLSNSIIRSALLQEASDIHLNPSKGGGGSVSLRINGKLVPLQNLLPADYSSLISRFKVLASIDITESRKPQDGAIQLPKVGIDLRLATIPAATGEKLTLRLIDQNKSVRSLHETGMSEKLRKDIEKCLQTSHGMIIVSGATGSGKSTTMFACVDWIIKNKKDWNVMTVENPVEHVVDGTVQIPATMNTTFSQALRSILRHDPDVIVIGEIRDEETAGIALHASMTGHLVLASVHASSLYSSITRLLTLDIDEASLITTLRAVINQKIIGINCHFCRELKGHVEMKNKKIPHYEGTGCEFCRGSGIQSRRVVFTPAIFKSDVKNMIQTGLVDYISKNNFQIKVEEEYFDLIENGALSLSEYRKVIS